MSKKSKLGAYLLITGFMLCVTVLFVMLDVIASYTGDNLQLITLLGHTATKQEWHQNIFLVGIFTISLPSAIAVGFYAGRNDLEPVTAGIFLVTTLIICSAVWDLLFLYIFLIPTNATDWVGPWFDPFGITIIQTLATLEVTKGLISMDADFLVFFSYLRLFIFLPALGYQLWRVYH